ncbi:MAG: RNA polymerase sigma-70 factor (ECF subfamily) [Crocinitomicaceae bacterium]|jgi:RNA polymerase sigma-70 factor (ECF subfamily)
MHLDDQSFLELNKRNKDKAFSYLVDAYSSKVFNTCINLIRSREDAEDVTQEVFTAVYLSLDTFGGDSKLSTWIYSIALNKSKEFLRKKTRKKRSGMMTTIEKDDSHTVPNATIEFNHPGVLLENKERTQVLFHAIDQLAENQKISYTLHKIEGMSYSEIAELTELSVSSVESLMFRAKKKLHQLLEDYYKENEQ